MDMNAGLRKILPESEKNFQKMLRNFRLMWDFPTFAPILNFALTN